MQGKGKKGRKSPMESSPGGLRLIEWRGRTGPFALLLTPRVFPPTHTSRVVAEALDVPAGATVAFQRPAGPFGKDLVDQRRHGRGVDGAVVADIETEAFQAETDGVTQRVALVQPCLQ